jgi:serine/threonine-protein kinase
MELCAGGSVGAYQSRRGGKLPLDEVARIALDAMTGLAYAHERKFVHRDLKPDNLLMTERDGGTIKVADFGLAKSFDKAGLSGMTATSTFGGTPLFMAREQLANFKKVKPVTDVWSLGATMYWLLTAQPVRDFSAAPDPMLVILGESAIPIRKRDPSIPPRVAEVIDRALADEVGDRYATMLEFRTAFERAL